MLAAKQVADLITLSRGLLAIWLTWLGITQGDQALLLVIWIMIIDWTGDSIDGPIARRSREYYHTWIGDHDLEIDITVSAGLLIYLLGSGYLPWQWAVIYLLIWAVVFWRWGYNRSLGMLIQSPIYGWFIYVAVREPPHAGWYIIVWIVAALAITWPKFPKEVIPGWFKGIRAIQEDELAGRNGKKK